MVDCRASIAILGGLLLGAAHFALVAEPANAQSGGETYAPLAVGPLQRTVFPADPRLDLGSDGTIELWLAASEQTQAPNTADGDGDGLPPPVSYNCVLQHGGTGNGDNFRVEISSDRRGVYLLRDAQAAGGYADLTDGASHHVAFVTVGDRTSFYLDGELQVESAAFGYLPPTVAGRPLALGCDDTSPAFNGWISTIRLWDRALTPDEIGQAKEHLGLPPENHPAYDALVAYSTFSNRRTTLAYTQPEILFTPMAGSPVGDTTFHKRPQTLQPAGFFVRPNEHGIVDIITEYDGPERMWGQFTGRTPVFYPDRSVTDTRAAVAGERDDLVAARALPADDTERESTIAAAEAELTRWIQIHRRNALGFPDDAIKTAAGPPEDDDAYGVFRPEPRRLEDVKTLTGTHDGARIVQLRFVAEREVVGRNDRYASELFRYPFGEHPPYGPETFTLTVPDGARFEGLVVRRSDDAITGLGLAYAYPHHPAAGLAPAAAAVGLWVDRNFHEPERSDAIADPDSLGGGAEPGDYFHGTYATPPYYAIDYVPNTKVLIVRKEAPDLRTPIEIFEFEHAYGNVWRGENERRLFLDQDKIHWLFADGTYERTLQRPRAYEEGGRDKIAWGGTFSLEQRPTFVDANFKGYNPMRMRARDNQSTSGSTKHIFAFPAEASTDYYLTSNHLIVPHGLFFRYANRGTERSRTTVTTTATERQRAWSVNVGLKVGVPLIANFAEDGEYQQEQESMSSREYATGIARTVQSRHALVLNRGQARLDPEFAARIREFAANWLNERERDYTAFFNSFGTHFANAVTYGGMAYLETTYTNDEAVDGATTRAQVKAELEGTLEELLSVGASGGTDQSWSAKFTDKFSNDRAWFDTVGGSISRDKGWSLGRGEEIPLLLDLRPLHTLLGPTFFDDPVIWEQIRPEMAAALDTYVQAWLDTGIRDWARSERGWRSILAATAEDEECTGEGCVEP